MFELTDGSGALHRNRKFWVIHVRPEAVSGQSSGGGSHGGGEDIDLTVSKARTKDTRERSMQHQCRKSRSCSQCGRSRECGDEEFGSTVGACTGGTRSTPPEPCG